MANQPNPTEGLEDLIHAVAYSEDAPERNRSLGLLGSAIAKKSPDQFPQIALIAAIMTSEGHGLEGVALYEGILVALTVAPELAPDSDFAENIKSLRAAALVGKGERALPARAVAKRAPAVARPPRRGLS